MRIIPAFVAIVLLSTARHAAAVDLVPAGASWRYLDNGTDAGTAWRQLVFDASGWAQGNAELGYGDGGEVTLVGFGPDASNKYVTTYFVRHFNVSGAAGLQRLDLRLMRDDGAVVYLNGTEAARSNMPAGAIGYQTLAPAAVSSADESRFYDIVLAPALLREGDNVIAVEVHQQARTSTDVSFNLQLTAENTAARVTRGPYLQLGTPTGMTLRWRTDLATTTQAWVGTALGSLAPTPPVAGTRTEHVVTLAGLTPATPYYYAIGTAEAPIRGGDAAHTFETQPVAGTRAPLRIWVLGDSGTGQVAQRSVRDAFHAFNGGPTPDLWMMLGDNAYQTGTDGEFQAYLFDVYPETLRSAVLWPTFGNHDAGSASSATQTGPYYDQFTLPRSAEAGGVASGTEAYYAFDHGNVHFVCLDSHGSSRAVGSPMLTWLENDLAANEQEWTIAWWHHAPYAKGTHDADTDLQMSDMRRNINPILEAYGVDLVLAGHDHTYQRSKLIDGFYGSAGTFLPSHAIDARSGRPETDGAYFKPTSGPAAHEGTVYVVAGTSGQTAAGGTLNHPAMYFNSRSLGSLVIDIDGEQLTTRFVDGTGAVLDSFAIVKPEPPCLNEGEVCDTGLSGVCSTGTEVCIDDALECQPDVNPASEVCNGLDDDCDGAVDDGVACNAPPDANDDSFPAVQDDTLVVGGAFGVLANDVDPEMDALVALLAQAPAYGEVTLAPDGGFAYQPDACFSGADAFRYVAVESGTGRQSEEATVTLNVAARGPVLDFAARYGQVVEGGAAALTVRRSGGCGVALQVTCTPVSSVARSGTDFNGANQVVSLAAGQSTGVCSMPTLADEAVEGDEAFSVRLAAPTGGATLGRAREQVVNVRDEDAAGQYDFAAVHHVAAEGAGNLTVAIRRSGASVGQSSTVRVTTTNVTASAGTDYALAGNPVTLTFDPGVVERTVTVQVFQDEANEGNEAFRLALSSPSNGAVLGPERHALVTIADDDALPEFTLALDEVGVGETAGTVRVEVVRTGAGAAVSVSYSTTAGSASAGSDFPAVASAVLSFAAGERVKGIDVRVNDDAAAEGDESFSLGLSSPSVGKLGVRRRVVVRILDNEVPATRLGD